MSKNIRIVDAYGFERENMNTTNNEERVNISQLPIGVYTVIVTKNNEIATQRLQVLP